MGNFASGKHAFMISDRSGMRFPYTEMVQEWNGAWVHISEFEKKQPQLQPRPTTADPQALQHARPAREALPTPSALRTDPYTTTAASTVVNVQTSDDIILDDTNPFQTNDAIRFYEVKSPVGGVSVDRFQMETTLNGNISASATTITLTDATNFPTSGFIVIEKIDEDSNSTTFGEYQDETIEYTGKAGNDLTGCTRGTSAPTYGRTYKKTVATTHDSGAKVFGSYKITRQVKSATNDAGSSQNYSNSFTFDLAATASSAETGGGFFVFAGPVNQRA